MRVFITGASGYIGSALVEAFAKAGHTVGGLVRSKEKEAGVKALGGVPIFGHLEDPELYQHFAAESDVVIHAAAPNAERDAMVVEELVSAMKAEGLDKTFILTSGCLVLGVTGDAPVDEKGSTENPFAPVAWRPALEQSVLRQAEGEFHTAVIRPGFVYGGKKGGVLAGYVKSALERGASEYIGEGKTKMAYVHLEDVASLYLKVAEKRGSGIFHAGDSSNLTNAELAAQVSKAAGKDGKTQGIPLEDAVKQMGPFATAFGVNQRLGCTRSAELGWVPKHKDIRDSIAEVVKALGR